VKFVYGPSVFSCASYVALELREVLWRVLIFTMYCFVDALSDMPRALLSVNQRVLSLKDRRFPISKLQCRVKRGNSVQI